METDDVFKTNVEDVLEKERDKNENFDFFKLNNNLKEFWGYDCNIETQAIKPLYLQEFGQKSNELVFTIKTNDWMDPKSLVLEFEMVNTSDNIYRFDGSCHSLFSEMTIFINDVQVENIKDYGKIHAYMSEVKLSRNERRRRKAEGFGYNKNGDNEMLIYNKSKYTLKKYDKETKSLVDDINNNRNTISNVFDKDINNNPLNQNQNNGIKCMIKIESALIGNRISKKNWKLIPLSQMKIQIILRVSSNWGFVLSPLNNIDDIEKHLNKIQNTGNAKLINKSNDFGYENRFLIDLNNDIVDCAFFNNIIPNAKISGVKIINPQLKFQKYSFSDDWNNRMIEIYKNQPMINEYVNFDIVLNKWMENNDNPNVIATIMLARAQERVRAIYATAYVSNVDNGHIRPFARKNLGFSIFQIQGIDRNWPIDYSFSNTEVISTSGEKSISPVLEKILRLNNVSKNSWSDDKEEDSLVVNNLNMSNVIDSSHIDSIGVDIKNINNEYIPTICRWSNIIKFDGVPFSNDKVFGGINIDGLTDTNFVLKKSELFRMKFRQSKDIIDKILDSNKQKYNDLIQSYKGDFYLTFFMESVIRVAMSFDGNVTLI